MLAKTLTTRALAENIVRPMYYHRILHQSTSSSLSFSRPARCQSTGSSTEVPSSSSSASSIPLPVRPRTSKNPRPTVRPADARATLAAAALLSRSPLLLRPLSPFESAYYQYQRELNQALSKPIRSSFFFRPGSHAARAFELSVQSSSQSSLESAPSSHTDQADSDLSTFQNIERSPHRSIYLFIRCSGPPNQKPQWQLPTSRIQKEDTLIQASLRAIHTTLGPNMDIWSVGKVPATVYTPPDSRFEKVWVMPQRILRGKPNLSPRSLSLTGSSTTPDPASAVDQTDTGNSQTSQVDQLPVEDFAWFTADEIRDRVDQELWNALEPILK